MGQIMTLLSILIPTVPARRNNVVQTLLTELEKQVGNNKEVEILSLYDNRRMTIGEKRNMLLSLARGKYLTFIDDDDMVAPDYISEILKVIHTNASEETPIDCITFIQDFYRSGQRMYPCTYSKDFEYTKEKNNIKMWTGKPAHTMIWRSEIAKQRSFPLLQTKEDVGWCVQVTQLIKREHFINKVLYMYMYDPTKSESRKPFV